MADRTFKSKTRPTLRLEQISIMFQPRVVTSKFLFHFATARKSARGEKKKEAYDSNYTCEIVFTVNIIQHFLLYLRFMCAIEEDRKLSFGWFHCSFWQLVDLGKEELNIFGNIPETIHGRTRASTWSSKSISNSNPFFPLFSKMTLKIGQGHKNYK